MTNSLHIISANDLRSGLNVYFIQGENNTRWDTDMTKASVYDDDDSLSAAFDLAKLDMERNVVVECLIVPVDETHAPLTTRERIRAEGPSIKYGHTPK